MLRIRIVARRPARGVRALGTWAQKFESARGTSLASRRALGAEVEGSFKIELDEQEARALEAEAGSESGSNITYVLSVENTAVGILRAALMPSGGDVTGLLIGAQVDPALSLSTIGKPLIHAACDELRRRGAVRVMAVAPLPGLCSWIVTEEAWKRPELDADAAGAVEAIAKGIPRKGHSVLGQGTFKAGMASISMLALEYADAFLRHDADSEVAMFLEEGAELARTNYMHAQDPESLRDCVGCTVALNFPAT